MKLPKTFTGKKDINVIIETPKGSRNKYTFDPDTQLFKLSKAFPTGMFFPVDFGFIPNTMAEDGDPMDVLVFMEDPSYPGCLVECKVLGIIKAEQEKNNKIIRNDRVLAAAIESRAYSEKKSYKDLEEQIIEDIIQFFINYHKRSGDKFNPLDTKGPDIAIKLIKKLCNNGSD